MTETAPSTPAATPPPAPEGKQQTPPASPAQPNGKQPPWGEKPENFDADKAWELIQNLRSEKADPQLRSELDAMKQQQTAQRDALAAALGVKPEETSDTNKLAQQIETLRGQITASERRALAVEYKVPEGMLTGSTADEMRQQAQSLVEFAQAAHYAAATSTPAPPAPAFQQNPGQGQGNTPLTPEAAAAAEYERYYDPATGRPRFTQ